METNSICLSRKTKTHQCQISWDFCNAFITFLLCGKQTVKKAFIFGLKFLWSIMWPMSFTEIYEESWPIRRRQMLQLLLINFYNKTCLYNLYSEFKGWSRTIFFQVDRNRKMNQK